MAILSIIIPVYNVEQYLSDCLNSVLQQSLSDMEIICVNDGSTDASPNIVKEYQKDHHNFILINQPNGGLSAARNAGLKKASGEYVFFLDSDDTLNDDSALNEMYILAQKQEADIVVFNALINGETPYLTPFPTQTEAINGAKLMQLFYNCSHTLMIPIWGHLYRKRFLLDNNLWFKEGIYHEDILFTPIAQHLASRTICHDTCVVNYRWQRPGAITSKETIKHYIDKRNSGRELYHWFSSSHVSEEEPYRMIFSVYIELIHSLSEKKINPHTILDSSDYEIMEQCYRTDYEARCYHLAKYSPNILMRYQNNTIPPIVRKAINRFL